MRLRYRLVGAVVLLTLTVGGTVGAAPIYSPTSVVAPEYDLQPVSGDVPEASEDALWRLMTDAGAARLDDLGSEMRSTPFDFTVTTYMEPGDYEVAVGEYEIITFDDTEGVVSPGEILYEQYLDVGVVFADGAVEGDGDDDIVIANAGFLEDGYGVDANGTVEVEFLAPQTHMGVDFPGFLRIELYQGENLLWTSADVGDFGTSGLGHFGGLLVSGGSFDRVVLSDPVDPFLFIDNLRYDEIPEPSTFLLLGVGSLAVARWGRRRREPR